jgi:hypothetical protein
MITQRPELARTAWRASSYSAASGNCVEVAQLASGHRAVRDSKNPAGPVLTCTLAQWFAFTTGARAGQFD